MTLPAIHPASAAFIADARIKADDYDRLYAHSLAEPKQFWSTVAERLDWMR